MRAGETKQDGSFSKELMCFVGVFPPEPGLNRQEGSGHWARGREEVARPVVAPSLLLLVWTSAGPILCFPVSLPAFAKG